MCGVLFGSEGVGVVAGRFLGMIAGGVDQLWYYPVEWHPVLRAFVRVDIFVEELHDEAVRRDG